MRRVTRPITTLLASVALLAACGSDNGQTATSAPPDDTKLPVVVDTDMAADDIIALLYLASAPDIQLLAVTVSGTGEVMCPLGAGIARGLLAAVGERDVPVACGPSEPLSGDRVFPLEWRAAANSAYHLELPEVAAPAEEPDAVTLLKSTIGDAQRPVTVLMLGPLTNLALALEDDNKLVEDMASVVIMGGAVDVPGNVQPADAETPLPVEWNLYIDPDATAAVLSSKAPVVLVPLDATNQVAVPPDLVDRVEANDTTDATALMVSLLNERTPPYLWDPLAAIAAAEPALVPGSEATIAVVTEGDEAGRTLAASDGTTMLVADPPVTDAIVDHLLRTLAGLGPDQPLAEPAVLPTAGEATVSFDGTTCTAQAPTAVPLGALIVTVEATGVDYVVIVAHLVEGATTEEALAYSAANPGSQPPMVDVVDLVGEGEGFLPSPAAIELHQGTTLLGCGTPTGAIFPGAEIKVG